ncbi:MAG: glutamate--tRNA ligase family protein [archaeon]
MKDFENKARAYALKNAVSHGGKSAQGAVISALFNEGLKKEEVVKYAKKVFEIVNEINKLSIEQQEKEFEKLKDAVSERPHREGLPELPNVPKTGVIMRFAPSPSGAFHIGHAMTGCISFDYVMKYGGKFYVRIEDTNPENIYEPAYKMIEEESKWLFNKKAIIVVQSDRMKLYYNYAEKLIKKGFGYVCTCPSEKFKKFVDAKKDCPCRKLEIKEQLERWKNMLNKSDYNEGEAVLRFKSNMKHKNPAMRDFPLARINLTEHPKQKKKYRVWPLMNLSVTVDDIELGMTHVIRAKEHRDNAERQKMICKCLGLEKKFPWTAFLGRYKFIDMELSATKITQGIKDGKYSGWDDPSLPTIAALKKKGYKPEAFWKFAEQVGLSESDKVMEKKEYFNLLDTFNRI